MAESIVSAEYSSSALGKIIAKNTAFVTLGGIALKVLNFLFSVYVVRRLGDERFGQYSIVLAFVGLFQIFAELGISQYVGREMARDRSRTPHLLWDLVALRLILALIGIGGITWAASLSGYAPILVLGILIYTTSFILSAIAVPLEMVLWANERLDYNSLKVFIGQLVFMGLGGIFLFSGLSFIWLIVASMISIIPQILLSIWAIRRHRLPILPVKFNTHQWVRLIWAGLPFGLISLALTIDFSVDTVMLSRFQPAQVAGWYNVAYGLERSLLFFFSGFSVAVVPSLSRAYARDVQAVEKWYYRTVRFILLSSLPVAAGGMVVAYSLIHFLYTPEFLPSARSLQIIIWDFPFLMFASFCGNMTTVVVEERSAARIYIISAIANVLLNLYAIPRYSYLGASAVTVITDMIASVQFYYLLRRKLNLPGMGWVLARVSLAAVLMGSIVWLTRDLYLFLQIGLGAVVYTGFILLFRVLDNNEWELIWRGLNRLRNLRTARQSP